MHTRIRAIILVVFILGTFPVPEYGAAQTNQEARAAEAAIELSQYEAQGFTGSLYNMLHLDAKVLIPASAIYGWYQSSFFPNGPSVITVTNVEIVTWTWEVTGVTYPETAEVSFSQPFTSGETVEDVVRLVEDNGAWYWFFGRSTEFVNEQIAQYAPDFQLIDDTTASSSRVTSDSAPWGLGAFPTGGYNGDAFLNTLPATVNDHILQSTEILGPTEGFLPSYATEAALATYISPPETVIPSGEVRIYTLQPGLEPIDALNAIEVDSQFSPHFVILRESRTQTDGIVFMFVELFANDAVGNVPVLYWGSPDGTQLFAASMVDYLSLRTLVARMTQAAS